MSQHKSLHLLEVQNQQIAQSHYLSGLLIEM